MSSSCTRYIGWVELPQPSTHLLPVYFRFRDYYELSVNAFGIVALACGLVCLCQAVSGHQPAFHMPAYTPNQYRTALYFGLGGCPGLVRILYSLASFHAGYL